MIEPILDALLDRVGPTQGSIVVAIDGRSGAGKSTLAAALAKACSDRGITASVIAGDDFYAGGTAAYWDRMSPVDKANHVIDWRSQLRVLTELRAHGTTTWYSFDWDSPDWDGEPAPRSSTPTSIGSADVVILEGAYSARPELHDVVDVRVLLDTPPERRRRQLVEREGADYQADWEQRWSAAEDHYLGTIMPPDRFDLVV